MNTSSLRISLKTLSATTILGLMLIGIISTEAWRYLGIYWLSSLAGLLPILLMLLFTLFIPAFTGLLSFIQIGFFLRTKPVPLQKILLASLLGFINTVAVIWFRFYS